MDDDNFAWSLVELMVRLRKNFSGNRGTVDIEFSVGEYSAVLYLGVVRLSLLELK